MDDFLKVAVLGTAANIGGGGVFAIVALPVIYFSLSMDRSERKLSLWSLLGLLIVASLTTGLVLATISRFVFTAETAYRASFPAIVFAFAFAWAILELAWDLKVRRVSSTLNWIFVFLVAWLVVGGGYLQFVMYHRGALPDLFWIVAIAPVLIVVAVSFISILIARRPPSDRKESPTPFTRNSLIASLALLLILISAGIYLRKHSSGDLPLTPRDGLQMQDTPIAEVSAFITSQNAAGATESDLTQDALTTFEQWQVNTILEKTRTAYAQDGKDPMTFNPKVESSSVYVTAEGKKLAIIKARFEQSVGSIRTVLIVGLNGNELVRVSCLRMSDHDIPVFHGECGQKLHEGLAVSVTP